MGDISAATELRDVFLAISQEILRAIHDDRWIFTILGAYKRRWAPCV